MRKRSLIYGVLGVILVLVGLLAAPFLVREDATFGVEAASLAQPTEPPPAMTPIYPCTSCEEFMPINHEVNDYFIWDKVNVNITDNDGGRDYYQFSPSGTCWLCRIDDLNPYDQTCWVKSEEWCECSVGDSWGVMKATWTSGSYVDLDSQEKWLFRLRQTPNGYFPTTAGYGSFWVERDETAELLVSDHWLDSDGSKVSVWLKTGAGNPTIQWRTDICDVGDLDDDFQVKIKGTAEWLAWSWYEPCDD